MGQDRGHVGYLYVCRGNVYKGGRVTVDGLHYPMLTPWLALLIHGSPSVRISPCEFGACAILKFSVRIARLGEHSYSSRAFTRSILLRRQTDCTLGALGSIERLAQKLDVGERIKPLRSDVDLVADYLHMLAADHRYLITDDCYSVVGLVLTSEKGMGDFDCALCEKLLLDKRFGTPRMEPAKLCRRNNGSVTVYFESADLAREHMRVIIPFMGKFRAILKKSERTWFNICICFVEILRF
jgi:hypothetical protein